MRGKVQNYYSIIIPEVIKLLNTDSQDITMVKTNSFKLNFPNDTQSFGNETEVLEFLKTLIGTVGIDDYLPQIITNLIKHLELSSTRPEAVGMIFECFVEMCRKDQDKFLMFLPSIIRVCSNADLKTEHLTSQLKNIIVENEEREELKLLKGNSEVKNNLRKSSFNSNSILETARDESNQRKHKIERDKLVKEFDTVYCSIEEDWKQWFKSTSKALFEQSPSIPIFFCHNVVDYYTPLLTELYNYAFISCWRNLNDLNKSDVVTSLKNALNNTKTPNEILLIILNLAEFIERDDNQIDFIEFQKLGEVANNCQAYAKALYYKENFYRNSNDYQTLEELISLYYKLKLPESAIGILKMAQKHNQIKAEDDWYIKLHKWKEGLELFNLRLKESQQIEYYKGKCLCLDGLSDWEGVLNMTEVILESEFSESKDEVCNLLSKAAFNLCEWEKLEQIVNSVEMKSDIQGYDDMLYSQNFYKAILSIKNNRLPEALKFIEKSRLIIDEQIKNLLGESYERAYKLLLENQYLFELEEIIMFKQNDSRVNKEFLKTKWNEKFDIISDDILSYETILSYRNFVFSTNEDFDKHLELAKICRKEDNFLTALNVLNRLKRNLGEVDKSIEIKVELEIQKCLWELGKEEEALKNVNDMLNADLIDMGSELKSKLYCRSGIWKLNLRDSLTEINSKDIIDDLRDATKLSENNYKAWHFYGFSNYKIFDSIKANSSSKNQLEYAKNSIVGYTKSVSLGGKNISRTLQDLLQLIDIWFDVGGDPDIDNLINKSFVSIDLETWLLVIPQLLARVNTIEETIKSSLLKLLKKMGKMQPRALVYNLVVMCKANNKIRRAVGLEIISQLEIGNKKLVEDAFLITEELNRCALLLLEEWMDAIEEGAKLYFKNNNINGMIKLLMNAHSKMDREPQTINEINFYQNYMRIISSAKHHLTNYIENNNDIELKMAWDIYHNLFYILKPNLEIEYLDLESISNKLCKLTECEIDVPGHYKVGYPVIKIKSFQKRLQVLVSKQHPRKLSITGSDEKEYTFCLKGHEDLRQDERAMQLFGLVNILLANDTDTGAKNLFIKRYSIIPLSNNTGLIGWVPNCDIINNLIKEYRKTNGILQNAEHQSIKKEAPNFDSLPFLNKLEIFKHTLNKTFGIDLYKVLWKKSKNSETWLDRRTLYSRSLAVMSMVGYILGLGDRHPSNLMLDRISGKIIHIDFGDCFEVAMKRDKFPEKVPFRLTRMLIKALEVSGIEGTFRITCENVMRVLRENKDSLMAILSSFIDDPLISFRIMIPLLSKKKNLQKKVTNSYGGHFITRKLRKRFC